MVRCMVNSDTAQDSPEPELIRLLDTIDAMPEAEALRRRTYESLRIDEGTSVVDVGCGAGRAVGEMLAAGAEAYGVDIDAQMLAVARRRCPDADIREASAEHLPFPDGTLHAYRADKIFHALEGPDRALAEAARVLSDGGRIVLVGQDWDAFVIDSDDAAFTRLAVHARADAVPGPRNARRYRNLLLDAGFEEVDVEVHTGVFTDETMLPMLAGIAEGAAAGGAVAPERARAWMAEQTERARSGRLFLAVPLFLASARRPG